MKKILYLILSLIVVWLLSLCFSNWSFETVFSWSWNTRIYWYSQFWNVNNSVKYPISQNDIWKTYCLSWTIISSACTNNNTSWKCAMRFWFWKSDIASSWFPVFSFAVNTWTIENWWKFFGCITYFWLPSDAEYLWIVNGATSYWDYNMNYEFLELTTDNNWWWSVSCDYSWYILESSVDQSYCVNNNLCPSSSCDYSWYILESEVTQNYCELTYNLISPSDCPSSWWTGDVNWSSFFVNSRQVQGASNVYLFLPDFLNWDYTYIDNWSTLEINVENQGDQDYINDILTIQSYHPSSEDFTQSFTWTLTLLMPYIIICLFIIFLWKLIRKIFK